MAAPIPTEVHRYLDELLTAASITSSGKVREQLILELFERLNSFTITAYINSLVAKDRAAFDHIVAVQHPRQELEKFLHDHVPNFQQVHTKALENFRTLYLREVARARRG